MNAAKLAYSGPAGKAALASGATMGAISAGAAIAHKMSPETRAKVLNNLKAAAPPILKRVGIAGAAVGGGLLAARALKNRNKNKKMLAPR